MGESDTRRSSRVRPGQSQSQAPSSSSSTSGRAERSSRSSTNKVSSPQLTASTISEPPDDGLAVAEPLVRSLRSNRVREAESSSREKISDAGAYSMASSDNEVQEDDESVRCICGLEDYPGPPVIKDEHKHAAAKEALDLEPFLAADVPDEVAGFFLQCDVCKVWQHGGCVGILNADSSPEEYFCEKCRKDLHKISVASNGHTITKEKEKEPPKSPKGRESKSSRAAAAALASHKRRSTLNSRHVYDEEEELRRAIEASKEEAGTGEPSEGSTKRIKRGRSDSEEKTEFTKRQRTGSRSPTPVDETAIQDDSDDGPSKTSSQKSKSRNPTVRNQQRDLQKAEKEEREKQKAEAANKRKSRAERRRADDSDISEEVPLAARATTARSSGPVTDIPPPPPPPRAVSPQPTPEVKTDKSSSKSKKSGSRKKGRNQYTKDRDRSPGRSQSRDVPDPVAGATNASGTGTGQSRSRNARTQAKQEKDKEMSWLDMERRIAYWTDFTQRVEQDLNIDREALEKRKEEEKERQARKREEHEAGKMHTDSDKANNSTSKGTTAALTGSSSLNGTSATAAGNSGSLLRSNLNGASLDERRTPMIAATNGDSGTLGASRQGEKNEGQMNIQDRLDFIKGQIKSWHTLYGVDTRS
ncbi:uncharacterized protein PpBr36_09879 [Pyricularia pennisetigena]|uniref:uncharacterized protein n=1 Tax=Pyricularia pennisetigena TaxID=1578925 RepID=UPI001152D6D0|nr:uncharacterized protein PpBr36_09879 [Pyricularia pennisetigena]TLS22295.1 hypothetical protein PpBr36_09879 [Pyricularia pennisetigena]